MSYFDDNILDAAHSVITGLYADTGVWFPPNDADEQTAEVFFIEPTKRDGYGQNNTFVRNIANFAVDAPVVEYLKGQFPGLKEHADRKATQFIEIKEQRFQIVKVKAAFDGHTLYMELAKTAS